MDPTINTDLEANLTSHIDLEAKLTSYMVALKTYLGSPDRNDIAILAKNNDEINTLYRTIEPLLEKDCIHTETFVLGKLADNLEQASKIPRELLEGLKKAKKLLVDYNLLSNDKGTGSIGMLDKQMRIIEMIARTYRAYQVHYVMELAVPSGSA